MKINVPMPRYWLDRAVGFVSPGRQLNRMRARMALQVFAQHYEGGRSSRRTLGWKRPGGDPNAPTALSRKNLRDSARHLVRNNGHAQSALNTIVDDTVGWGIKPSVRHDGFHAWSESTDIDADGRCDLAGLEHVTMRAVAQDGEVLIRRRWRRSSDGLSLPLQLQILEADYLSNKTGTIEGGNRVVHGVEFDALGRRVAYHMFREHPGSTTIAGTIRLMGQTVRVPASEIIHVFRPERPGQVRGVSWFAPVLIRFNDFDEFADATLMKQKIAACLTVLTTDVDGTAPPLGTEKSDDAEIDLIEPGLIANIAPGRSIEIVNPPSVRDYSDYAMTTLREIAAGIGVTPEDMTGDYATLSFSAARMSRLKHWGRVGGWRWRMLRPQMLDRIWRWGMEAALFAGQPVAENTFWTAPPMPMIDPDKEVLGIVRSIRAGLTTLSEELRRRGLNVDEHWAEYASDFEMLDKLRIVLDCDARQMTLQGQRHKDVDGEEDDQTTAELRSLLGKLPAEQVESFMRSLAGDNGSGAAT